MPAPPGSATFEQEIQLIHKRLDELTRQPPPPPSFSCRVKLNVDVSLIASTDTLAQANWAAAATDDLSGAFTPGVGTPCYITIPADGYYTVNFHAGSLGAAAGQTAANKVTRNSTSVSTNASIATDATAFGVSTSEGAVLNAYRARVKLLAGDKLYWSIWVSAASNLLAVSFGVPSEMTVQFISAQ